MLCEMRARHSADVVLLKKPKPHTPKVNKHWRQEVYVQIPDPSWLQYGEGQVC